MENPGLGELAFLSRPREEWPVGRLFAIAARLSGPATWRLIEKHGISPAGFFLLRLLVAEDGLRPGEVARRLHVTPATVTTVVDTLERNGHVRRERSYRDRRGVMLRITDSGRRLLSEKAEPVGRDLFGLYDVVDEEDAPAVRRFLLKLIEKFERDQPEDERAGGGRAEDERAEDGPRQEQAKGDCA